MVLNLPDHSIRDTFAEFIIETIRLGMNVQHWNRMSGKAAEILGLDDVEFIEPSYDRMIDDSSSALLLTGDIEEMRMLVDPDEWPLALAASQRGKWRATNFLYHAPSMEAIEAFERLSGRIFEEEREEWLEAVREYYSNFLLKVVPPAVEDFSERRMDDIVSLLTESFGNGNGKVCLDCGCGSGIGSFALKKSGYRPLSIDNDSSLLSLGLKKERLDPKWTILLDATVASRYIEPLSTAVVLMAGSINDFNSHIWKAIVEQVAQVADRSLITTETEKEIKMVSKWASDFGLDADAFENRRDPIYDRWVCIIESV